jgi:O-antigen/teichoic acid export membrane protein
MLAEGMFQFIIAVQSNMSPLLSLMKAGGRMDQVKGLVRKNTRLLCPALAAVSAVTAMVYPYATVRLTGDPGLASGWIHFAVLMFGMTVSASYLPFANILNQWGHPTWFMVYSALLVGTNILLNALLIPLWGALGSAVATALAFVLMIVYLKALTRFVTGIAI